MKKELIGAVSMIGVLALCCTGCIHGRPHEKSALKYMNSTYGEKYDDEFEVLSADYGNMFNLSVTDKYEMSSKNLKDFSIYVNYLDNEYLTDYIEKVYCKQYQEYMQPIFENVFGECNVLYVFKGPSGVYTQDTTFEDFLKLDTSLKELLVIVKDDQDMKDKAQRLIDELEVNKTPIGMVRFFVLNDYQDAADFRYYYDWISYKKSTEKGDIIKAFYFTYNRDYEIRSGKEIDWNSMSTVEVYK